MRINEARLSSDQKLTTEEQQLIEKVLSFRLKVNSTTIRFKNIAERVEELELSPDRPARTTQLDIDALNSELYILRKQLEKFSGYDLEHNRECAQKYNEIRNRINQIAETIENGGIAKMLLFGLFIRAERKVILYLGNMGSQNKRPELITTFIHEMFHAWNHFAYADTHGGSTPEVVREIDEAMTEFSSLLFLKEISATSEDFKEIKETAEDSVKDKQRGAGDIAAYGFGYYLYSLIGTKDSHRVKQLYTSYGAVSGELYRENELVRKAVDMLFPFYPFNEEEEVFNLFYKIIVRVTGQIFGKDGKTNIKKSDGSYLFDNGVDEIREL